MTPALQKMWISFAAMIFMTISIVLIYFSRFKLKGFFKAVTTVFAFILMVLAGIIVFLVVLSGPTNS
ncbi:DUF2768 domain-containing protein [Bacillus sp. JJ722]|uniref:DUF2768 domain-containing protein n=1 Tax=Bacillus sp. JJ722 TaxID=3122973 RepID=UPI002FFFA92F